MALKVPGRCSACDFALLRADTHLSSLLLGLPSVMGFQTHHQFIAPMPPTHPTPGQAVCQPSFAALFCQFLAGSASGLTFLNNLASITMSLGAPVGGQVVFVSLFSVANACGECSKGCETSC